jgi:hypothetical protein
MTDIDLGDGADSINTFCVAAGHFTYFRVVSRRSIQSFRRSARFLGRVRFPAAPLSDTLVSLLEPREVNESLAVLRIQAQLESARMMRRVIRFWCRHPSSTGRGSAV